MAKTKAKAKTSQSKASLDQTKNSLRQLRKLGLYDPVNARKSIANPTRYAKSLVKKYQDVLGSKPRASTIKIPKSAVKDLATQYKTKRTRKGAVAIVHNAGGMKATYSKKAGGIVRKDAFATLTPIKDRMILLRGGFPKLKKGEAVVVRVGNSYKYYYSLADVSRDMLKYDPQDTTLWQFPYIGRTRTFNEQHKPANDLIFRIKKMGPNRYIVLDGDGETRFSGTLKECERWIANYETDLPDWMTDDEE